MVGEILKLGLKLDRKIHVVWVCHDPSIKNQTKMVPFLWINQTLITFICLVFSYSDLKTYQVHKMLLSWYRCLHLLTGNDKLLYGCERIWKDTWIVNCNDTCLHLSVCLCCWLLVIWGEWGWVICSTEPS